MTTVSQLSSPASPAYALLAQPFESDIFGAPLCRIALPPGIPSTAELMAMTDKARREGVALIACRLPAGNAAAGRALEGAGFYEIETLVTLARDIPASTEMPAGVAVGGREDAETAAALARTCFTHDRYHADPSVPQAIADEIKARWVRNGFNGRADAPLVARGLSGLAGFNLCLLRGSDAIIDLIGVAETARGQGFGRKLVLGALAHYAGRASRMLVGTQSTNTASLGLYRSLGFADLRAETTWHWRAETG